jgi:hypothetical protein
VTLVDALVISAGCQRPIRFVMDHNIFRIPLLSFVFRTAKTIPIASAKEDPQTLERAYDEIAGELEIGGGWKGAWIGRLRAKGLEPASLAVIPAKAGIQVS